MSMFKRMLSRVGVGNVTIDTQLEYDSYQAGSKVTGRILITGGSVPQTIQFIDIILMTKFRDSDGNHVTFELEKYPITGKIQVEANDSNSVDFYLQLPPDIPATLGHAKVWMHTIADVSNAVDPTDDDAVTILPHPVASGAIQALERLGFRLREAEIEEAHPEMDSHYPFIQELEFVPDRAFKGKLKELEMVCIGYDDHADLFFEIDKRKGFFGTSERHARVAFNINDAQDTGHMMTYFEQMIYDLTR